MRGLPNGWSVKSVVYNGQAVIADSFLLDLDTEHQQLVITLSDKIAELNGAAMKDGKPISEAYVIVAPSTRKLIRNWPESILVRAAADGKFCLRGISPAVIESSR